MILTGNQKRLLGRLIFLLIPYTLLRIGFYFFHIGLYKQFTEEEIFQSLLMGIRFDIATICFLNIPFILLSLFPRVNQKIERVLFIGINSMGFLSCLMDYELFLFVGKRLSFDFFVITEDILDQLPQLALYYWYLPLSALLLASCFYFLDKKNFSRKYNGNPKPFVQLLAGFVFLGMTFVGIRGGFQHKSINVQSAFVQGKNELGHLVLTTPYHFLRTLKNQRVEKLQFFKQDKEALNLILNHREFRGDYAGEPKWNVVLIILESFGLEYVEQGYAPFLKELKEKSLYFDKHLANGRRSIEGLPSLLCGLPGLTDEPISKSVFSGNKFSCMPQLLKDSGYTNQFFHAGARGTMGFEAYTLTTGFDRYFSKEDYPSKADFDGNWGIYDGPYLKYVAGKLDDVKEPFLTGVFTLSSHQPYSIPEKFKNKFPKGTLEIHESIGYTDFALREFFDTIKDRPWFKRTLFVITADHAQKNATKKFINLVGYYRVPLLFYAPGHTWKVSSTDKVTHHSDIPESVLDFLGVKSEGLPATGRSIFSEDKGVGLGYAEGMTYFMAQENKILQMDKSGVQTATAFDWETGEVGPEQPSQDPILKAYLQYFINGLIMNNLSLYR